jgi:hypothetical protein
MTAGETGRPENRATNPRENGVVLGACWVVNTAAVILLAVVLLVVAPRMTQVFVDFGTRLPMMTEAVIRFASSPQQVMVGLLLFVGAQIALYSLCREGRSLVLLLCTVTSLALAIGISLALYLPFVEIMTTVSGSGAAGE